MINFSVPSWVEKIIRTPAQLNKYSPEDIASLKHKLSKFNCSNPIVSIVIPAWNEENSILHTLVSIVNSNSSYATELIVVDNNSTDGTVALLAALGVTTLLEKQQGIGHARTNGLHHAKGIYILTADCDTIYPEGWVTIMAKTMMDGTAESVNCVHGSYSFLPGLNTPRWQYAFYEMLSSIVINDKAKTHPYLNVLGYNCGFIRLKGIAVNGYAITTQRTFRGVAGQIKSPAAADGMMALQLKNAGGKIQAIDHIDAKVWTSDRRIQIDGGIIKAIFIRVKKYFSIKKVWHGCIEAIKGK